MGVGHVLGVLHGTDVLKGEGSGVCGGKIPVIRSPGTGEGALPLFKNKCYTFTDVLEHPKQ